MLGTLLKRTFRALGKAPTVFYKFRHDSSCQLVHGSVIFIFSPTISIGAKLSLTFVPLVQQGGLLARQRSCFRKTGFLTRLEK